jgi:hypothetical protein
MGSMRRHRLRRDRAWGLWFLTSDQASLVHDSRESAWYEVPLADVAKPDDAQIRVETVVALKSAWVTQRVVDDLCRALRSIRGFQLPPIVVDAR